MTWTEEVYKEQLELHRDIIECGISLKLEDSETIGNKYTHANWGLCSRIADGQRGERECPMDKDPSVRNSGCFYRCRLFQGPRPTRKEAIQLYQIKLKGLE